MDATTFMVLVGIATALIGGYFVARQSAKLAPIRGGAPAQALHYLASVGMTGIPVTLLIALVVTIFWQNNILGDFVKYVLVSLAVVIASLLLFGVVEPDAPALPKDEMPPLD